MIYAVIDTDVLVSALLNFDSVPGEIIYCLFNGLFKLILNDKIYTEYQEVLSRPKLHFNQEWTKIILSEMMAQALWITEEHFDEKYIDPKDIVFYEITMTARKDKNTYLVTGNQKHYPKKDFVVTPRQMLDILTE